MAEIQDEIDDPDEESNTSGEHGQTDVVNSSTDRKKRVHIKCEQMRREAIKSGYHDLKDLLPPEFGPIGFKITNASVLFRAIEYLKQLQKKHQEQQEEIKTLKSQLVALQLICRNYEQLSVQQEHSTMIDDNQSLSSIKFQMFKQLMDYLFPGFQCKVNIDNYEGLTQSILSWLEHEVDFQCVPDLLSQAVSKSSKS